MPTENMLDLPRIQTQISFLFHKAEWLVVMGPVHHTSTVPSHKISKWTCSYMLVNVNSWFTAA